MCVLIVSLMCAKIEFASSWFSSINFVMWKCNIWFNLRNKRIVSNNNTANCVFHAQNERPVAWFLIHQRRRESIRIHTLHAKVRRIFVAHAHHHHSKLYLAAVVVADVFAIVVVVYWLSRVRLSASTQRTQKEEREKKYRDKSNKVIGFSRPSCDSWV